MPIGKDGPSLKQCRDRPQGLLLDLPGALALALPSPEARVLALERPSLEKPAFALALPVEELTDALAELLNPVPVTPLTLTLALADVDPVLALAVAD